MHVIRIKQKACRTHPALLVAGGRPPRCLAGPLRPSRALGGRCFRGRDGAAWPLFSALEFLGVRSRLEQTRGDPLVNKDWGVCVAGWGSCWTHRGGEGTGPVQNPPGSERADAFLTSSGRCRCCSLGTTLPLLERRQGSPAALLCCVAGWSGGALLKGGAGRAHIPRTMVGLGSWGQTVRKLPSHWLLSVTKDMAQTKLGT